MAIDMLEHSQDEMWKKSLYWTSSTKFYWNIVSLLFELLKDLSKIIVTLVEGPLLHDLVEGSHPFHPWYSPGLFWWRQGGKHPWKYLFFSLENWCCNFEHNVCEILASFVLKGAALEPAHKLLGKGVNHHHHHLHDRHHHQNRWDAPTEKDMLSLPLTSSPSGATTTPSGPRRSSRKKKKFSN